MKTSTPKTNSSTLNSHSSKPFFNKSGEGSFFSSSKLTNQPFFSPSFIQSKLTIGQPNDKYEQEADVMADKVMSMESTINSGLTNRTNHPLQTKLDIQKQEEPEEEPLQAKLNIQRQEEEKEEELLQTKLGIQKQEEFEEESLQTKPFISKASKGDSVASPNLTSKLNQNKGSGSPLPNTTNAFMSNAFGTDFSNVNVHTGKDAVHMNEELGAKAFTHGSDIYFNEGEYSPNSSAGKQLLAHELTHVVQQGHNVHSDIFLYPNPEESDFWEDLRRDVHLHWFQPVLNADERALGQFEDDLRSGEGERNTPQGNLALDAVDFGLDLLQAHPGAKFGIKLLQNVYNRLEETRSATLQLARFAEVQRLEHQTFEQNFPADWSEVNEDSEDLIRRLKNLKDSETDTNRIQKRRQAVQMLRSAREQIPDFRVVMRQLVRAWVAAASDQWVAEATVDLPDPAGFSAGYIRIYADIETDIRGRYSRHGFIAISIDDIDAPSGTKEAIESAFGNIFLDELPFPGRILLRMGSTYVFFEKRSQDATDDLEGWRVSTLGVQPRFIESTIESRRRLYFQHIRPRVQHLQPDD